MTPKTPLWIAVPILAAALSAPGAAAPDNHVATVLAQARTALGGDALERVKVVELHGKVTAGGLPGTGTAWQEVGGSRFSESYSNPPLVGADGYDGTEVWNRDGSGLVWVDGGQPGRTQEISQAFAGNYALWGPGQGGAAVAYGGIKRDGPSAFDVLVVTAPGAAVPFELWFDRSTHLPARMLQTIGATSSTTRVSDYRPVDGLMIPYVTHTESSDGNASDEIVTQAIANPPGAQSAFAKPPSTVHDFSMANGAAQTSVPFDLVENHVYLNVMLDGKGPYRFIYDSGGANIVDPAVAQEIGAIGKGSMQGGGVGSTTESVSFATVAKLQVGDAVLTDQFFGVAPVRMGFGLSGGQKVDGLIGFEVLSRFVTTFDYANRRVVLQMPQTAQIPPGGESIGFVLSDRTPQFPCSIDAIASQCSLDTGARDTITLFSPFVAAHPQVVPAKITAVGVNGFGFGGPALGKLGRLQSFGVGKFAFPNLVADFSVQDKGAFANPFQAANVGGNLWRRFSLTLDYPKSTMTLVPNGDLAQADVYERAGLFLLNRGGKFFVLDARPGTPAALAGLVKGDSIATVDGKPASSMSLQAVRELFYGAPGTAIHLGVVSKDGTTRDVTVVLQDFV